MLFPLTPLPHPQTKIVLLFSLDKRQQLAEATAGPGARPGRPGEDAAGTPLGSQAAAPTLQGAGDGAERRESARGRETKTILVKLLLLLGARLQQEKRRVAGGPGAGGGAKAAQGWRWLIARLLTESKAGRYAYPA